MKIYLIGSLRNPAVPILAANLRERLGIEIFDDWYAAGPRADDHWMEYEKAREHTYAQALEGHAARHVYNFDKAHLDDSVGGVLLLPAGKSGHSEFGYLRGQGKPVWILMPDGEPERWDVMYQFATKLVYTTDDLVVDMVRELRK